MKKIIALVCTLVMIVSMFTITTNAAIEGAEATLVFKGYETKGTNTLAVIEVRATIPEELVAFSEVEDEETLEFTYGGKLLQTVGFDIPYVEGLSFLASSTYSTAAPYVQIKNNTSDEKVQIYAANTGAVSSYYAGDIDLLATLKYKITGDVNATYNLALTDAVIGLVDVDPTTGDGIPREYKFDDFTVTNAVVKPAEPTPEKVENRITNFDKVIETEDTVWENLAVYTATFNLNDIVTSEGYGISVGANKLESKAAAVDGQGTVNMVLAYFGITEEQANDLVVNQFYSVIKDAE